MKGLAERSASARSVRQSVGTVDHHESGPEVARVAATEGAYPDVQRAMTELVIARRVDRAHPSGQIRHGQPGDGDLSRLHLLRDHQPPAGHLLPPLPLSPPFVERRGGAGAHLGNARGRAEPRDGDPAGVRSRSLGGPRPSSSCGALARHGSVTTGTDDRPACTPPPTTREGRQPVRTARPSPRSSGGAGARGVEAGRQASPQGPQLREGQARTHSTAPPQPTAQVEAQPTPQPAESGTPAAPQATPQPGGALRKPGQPGPADQH